MRANINRSRKNMAIRGLGVALLIVAVFGAACGSSDDPAAGGNGSPGDQPTTSETAPAPVASESSAEPVANTTVELWFATSEGLFLSYRTIPQEEGIGAAAIRELLSGPSSPERDADVGTTIPSGTSLLSLDIDDGIATVDLSSDFGSGGGSASMQMRVAQVVYTLTQFSTVTGVVFQMEGEEVEALGGEGLILDGPQRRKDHKNQLPAILVESPSIGAEVTSPLEVTGSANVFEATVSLRLVSDSGEVLYEGFTTATCGTGCRGDLEASVDFEVMTATDAVLEVFESSAKDGRPVHLVSIPLALLP